MQRWCKEPQPSADACSFSVKLRIDPQLWKTKSHQSFSHYLALHASLAPKRTGRSTSAIVTLGTDSQPERPCNPEYGPGGVEGEVTQHAGPKQLIQACLQVQGSFRPGRLTPDAHLEEALKSSTSTSPEDQTFVSEVFTGLLRYKKFLKPVVDLLYARHRHA